MEVINYSEMEKVGTFTFTPPSIILHKDESCFAEDFVSTKRSGDIVFNGEKDIFILPLYIPYDDNDGYWDDGALKTAFGVVVSPYIVEEKHFIKDDDIERCKDCPDDYMECINCRKCGGRE